MYRAAPGRRSYAAGLRPGADMPAALLLTLLACASRTPSSLPVESAMSEDAVTAAPAPPPPPPPPAALQGIESEGMRVEWVVEGSNLRCRMSAPSLGWLRVGFNTVRAQHLSNMIVGWVDATGAHVEDRFATDPPYIEPDLQLGGRSDVTLVSGSEADGRTTVEFTIPLDSGDSYDLALSAGQTIYLVLSYGPGDDLAQAAVVRTAVEITL